MKHNNKIKLKSKNENDFILVPKNKNGKIDINNKGFVKVWNHPTCVDTMNYEFIEMYYNIPENVEPI